jgi:hypothetical protein
MVYDRREPCGIGHCNVFTYPHLHNQTREGTATWLETKKPDVPEVRYLPPAGTVLAGLAVTFAGGIGIVLGMILMAAGVVWGMRERQRVEDAKALAAVWPRRRYCVACSKRIAPEGSPHEAM